MSVAYADLSFDDVAGALGLGDAHRIWDVEWDDSAPIESGGTMNVLNILTILDPVQLDAACRFLQMSDPARLALLQTLDGINDNPHLIRLLTHVHYLLFHSTRSDPYSSSLYPALDPALGSVAELFYVFVFLSGLAHTRQFHQLHHIEPSVTVATLSDLELWVNQHHDQHGRFGLSVAPWLARHFLGRVYRLGRLQFELTTYHLGHRALRNPHSGQILLMAEPDRHFRHDGQYDGSNGIHDPHPWESQFILTPHTIRGNLVDDRGNAQSGVTTLDANHWYIAMENGDAALTVHIPAIGPLAPELCDQSFAQALQFFPKHFPHHPFVGFFTETWLLDAQLTDYLPADSNIVGFLSRFHLLPRARTSDRQIFERVFGATRDQLHDPKMDNSLKRIIYEHITRGGHWRESSGLILKDELSQRLMLP